MQSVIPATVQCDVTAYEHTHVAERADCRIPATERGCPLSVTRVTENLTDIVTLLVGKKETLDNDNPAKPDCFHGS